MGTTKRSKPVAAKPKKPAAKKRTTPKAGPATAAPAKRWFKVVDGGKSCSGGTHNWSLPTADGPGEWHEIAGDPVLCETGFHVTEQPAYWMNQGRSVYVAEIDGTVSGPNPGQDDPTKVSAKRCRLVRLATTDELVAVGIYTEGEHRVPEGVKRAHASGSSTVTAYDSATVTASGSATVTAYGSAKVKAYDSATVTVCDSATVTAYGSATVKASGSSTVTAYDSATVTAYGSATVKAYDSATVTAYDSATVTAYNSATVTAKYRTTVITQSSWATVTLEDRAAEVNWASGWAEFRRASGPTEAA